MMVLTDENYFSQEANKQYMSVSQFKSFEECPAAAIAALHGEWERETTTSILVGSFVDAHFEGTLDVFQAKHPELFLKSGGLKSDYRKAEEIIQRIENDDAFMAFLSGKKQVIETAQMEGIWVKTKIDVLFPEKMVDMKIMKDFEPVWKDGQKMPWFAAWGYDLQGAVYQEVHRLKTGETLPFFLAAATKEKYTDVGGLQIPQEYMDERLSYFKQMLPMYQEMKEGKRPAPRCEHCDYCKSTKRFEVKDASELYYDMEG